MTLNKRTLGTILIFAFPVCLYQMFNIIWIDKQIVKLLYFLILTFVIIYVFPNLFRIKKHSKYEVPLRFLFITMWISIACAFLFWGQDVILSYRSSATYFGIVFFPPYEGKTGCYSCRKTHLVLLYRLHPPLALWNA